MKLKFTITFECPVANLADYEATTIYEAAKNQKAWFEEGAIGLMDLIPDDAVEVTVEGIE